MFHVPDEFRIRRGPMGSDPQFDGNNGYFFIPSPNAGRTLIVIASDGRGWEHVSVRAMKGNGDHVPYWDEMCFIKDTFWDDEDVVMQLHPKKSEYVNNHRSVLHLWRPIGQTIPTPPSILVGIKGVKIE